MISPCLFANITSADGHFTASLFLGAHYFLAHNTFACHSIEDYVCNWWRTNLQRDVSIDLPCDSFLPLRFEPYIYDIFLYQFPRMQKTTVSEHFIFRMKNGNQTMCVLMNKKIGPSLNRNEHSLHNANKHISNDLLLFPTLFFSSLDWIFRWFFSLFNNMPCISLSIWLGES